MLQAMSTLKKRPGIEIGLDQITGLTLAFFIGNSTLSTDSGHEYKWCPASNRIGVTSCGVTQITKATSWWQTSRSKVMFGANFDANGTVIMTSSNCATIKRLVSIMNSGAQCQRMQLPTLQAFALQTRHQVLSCTSRKQLTPPQRWVLRALQQVLP